MATITSLCPRNCRKKSGNALAKPRQTLFLRVIFVSSTLTMAKLGCLLPAKTERMWVWKVERFSMAKHVSRVALSFINKLMARYQKKL